MKRRSLLAALSVIPFAGPALSSTAEPADEWESDVCVIGAGLAGITAAIAAKTAGAANVCVLEKESLLEGHSTISTGYFSAVRHMPGHDAEYRAAVDSMIADMEKTGKGLGNPELIRILAENSGAAYDWMTSLGVTWLPDPYEALGGLVPRSYLTSFVNGGYDYIFAVNRRLRELRIPLYFGAEVTRVTPTDAGYVVSGSRLKKKFLVHAKTVILATGGYTANVELRSKYDPRLTREITSTANPYGDGLDTATGDGILFGEALGAELLDMDKILTIPFSGGRLTNYVDGNDFSGGVETPESPLLGRDRRRVRERREPEREASPRDRQNRGHSGRRRGGHAGGSERVPPDHGSLQQLRPGSPGSGVWANALHAGNQEAAVLLRP